MYFICLQIAHYYISLCGVVRFNVLLTYLDVGIVSACGRSQRD